MNKINLWESSLKDDYIFFNTIEEYINYLIENNETLYFIIKEGYKLTEEPKTILDNIALRSNTEVTYTDETHPITTIKNSSLTEAYINPTFFNKHKEEFINYFTNYIKDQINNKRHFINIPDFILTDELLDTIINNEESRNNFYTVMCFENLKLTDEQINRIKSNFIDFTIKNDDKTEKISSKYAFSYYTLSELKQIDDLTINFNNDNNQYENLIYLNDSATIIFLKDYEYKNEDKYLEEVSKVINILKTHNKKYNIKISINNRQKLKDSKIIDTLSPNINLYIENDNYKYNLETYIQEENILESIARPIRESNLSPLEKYLAAYNKVKQFKEYKENEEDKEQSRKLRFILNNEYLVCVGFEKLLEELLNRINIPIMKLFVEIDSSYDKGYTMEEIGITNEGHARALVKIDDDKYNIHGIYIADPTWDNHLKADLYLNSLMTFDRKKEAKSLERLTTEDLLLDFHNLDEFTKKIEYYLKYKIYKNYDDIYAIHKNDKEKAIKASYKNLIEEIIEIIYTIQNDKYDYFYKTYYENIRDLKTIDELVQHTTKLLTEYYQIIKPLTNNNIDISTIFKAATETKRTIDNYSDKEIKEWLEQIIDHNKKVEKKTFPYRYNKDNPTETYLEDAFPEEEIEKPLTR